MISIILPIYNGIEYLEECLDSILNQEFPYWELLIGINGHKENSSVYSQAKRFEAKSAPNKIRVFDFHDIHGKTYALNRLVDHAKYDWISIIDVDDLWHPSKLTRQLQFMEKYDVIGTRTIYFGRLNGIVPQIPSGDITDLDFLELSNPVINSSALVRKKLCIWNHEFHEGLEDFDLWLRLKSDGKKFYNCSEILVKHRLHYDSAFNNKDLSHNMAKLVERYSHL
jgi:glycosyltransferase involved in cell wall biosynthesis